MPRRARSYVAGLPYHVVQRGNNREACFIEPENYQFYLALWQQVSGRYGVRVHAYCLMTNHVHVLATPERAAALSDTMKVVGSRYAQYINRKCRRTGTLWEGRHRASLVQSERYLLTCCRYIELNPVRAGMVARPNTNVPETQIFTQIEEQLFKNVQMEMIKLLERREGVWRFKGDKIPVFDYDLAGGWFERFKGREQEIADRFNKLLAERAETKKLAEAGFRFTPENIIISGTKEPIIK